MKPLFLSFTFVIVASISFCQTQFWWANILIKPSKEKHWVTQVNKAVGPHFVLLDENYSSAYYYEEVDINKDGKKEVVVAATDTLNDYIKIFVFSIVANRLKLIDSSLRYQSAPQINAKADSLFIKRSYHRGNNKATYLFNKKVGKYFLISIENYSLEHFRNKVGLNDFWHLRKKYEVKTRKLKIESGRDYNGKFHDNEVWSKRKTIIKKMPVNISLRLSKFQDPGYDYDYFFPLLDEGKKLRKYFEYLLTKKELEVFLR